jgi:DNA modification methylase
VSVIILRGDAAHLPLPDASVDLICTSPPFWGLRDYQDGGESLNGQIGSEPTPGEYIANLLACTREWMRVLKPEGSIFCNLGDAYSKRADAGAGRTYRADSADALQPSRNTTGFAPRKSLLGLPWRYALGCVDDLGLILRAEILWSKANGMPESMVDRVRRSHEQVFHFTKQPRYFAAVDEIRQAHKPQSVARGSRRYAAGDLLSVGTPNTLDPHQFCNPLGALPGSVWEIPSQPLSVPAHLGVDHWAAFPMELPRRIILGWSPSGVCTGCGEGRRPVVDATRIGGGRLWESSGRGVVDRLPRTHDERTSRHFQGYACRCTPYTDHPERRGKDFHAASDRSRQGMNDGNGGERYRRYVEELANPRGPVREYDFDAWSPAPTRPAVIVDPFGGTGTTALVADTLGRTGITIDRSMDYARIAQWRTADPAERARALGVPKPPPVMDRQGSLFDSAEAGEAS